MLGFTTGMVLLLIDEFVVDVKSGGKTMKLVFVASSLLHAALRIKSKNWLSQNQDNVSECCHMSIRGLLFQ